MKNVFSAETTEEIVFFTAFHAAFTLFLKSSLVIYKVTRAVPTAAINVAIKTNGFAFMIALSAACAIVILSVDFFTVSITLEIAIEAL